MEPVISRMSVLTKGNVLTTLSQAQGQVAWLEQTVAERTALACADGGQCRLETLVEVDDEHLQIINIETSCQKAGALCQQTCDAFNAVLSSSQNGCLHFSEPVSLIE